MYVCIVQWVAKGVSCIVSLTETPALLICLIFNPKYSKIPGITENDG